MEGGKEGGRVYRCEKERQAQRETSNTRFKWY